MGLGNNVCFCYNDMDWTASNAFTGGKTSVYTIQIGRFRVAGSSAFDGPGGSEDGMDYLSGKSMCWYTKGTSIPPVTINVPRNHRIDLACGESIPGYSIDFVNPFRLNLTVTASHTWAPGLVVSTTQQAATTLARATIQWTPTAAATVNLTLTAFDGVETTIVPLTLTSPGQCCQGPTVEVWDPSTDALIGPLTTGGSYCLGNYTLRAIPCPEPAPVVDMKLWNSATGSTVHRMKEYQVPFFLYGNNDADVSKNPKPLPNGPYTFRFMANGITTEVPFTQFCS